MQYETGFDKNRLLPSNTHENDTKENIAIAETQLELVEKIGRGYSGRVYKCKLHGHFGQFRAEQTARSTDHRWMLVAVKEILRVSPLTLNEFNQKLYLLLVTLYHDNVIRSLGLVVERDRVSRVVLELAVGGCLHAFLESDFGQRTCIPMEIIKNWALQITDGLFYLHSKQILHSDLKARNIMLNQSLDTLASIDSVRLKLANISSICDRITPSHAAPEILRNYMCQKSNVWALGVVLWEMVFKRKPFDGLESLQIMYKVAIKRETLQLDDPCCLPDLREIIKSCWTYDFDSRPNVVDVRRRLVRLL